MSRVPKVVMVSSTPDCIMLMNTCTHTRQLSSAAEKEKTTPLGVIPKIQEKLMVNPSFPLVQLSLCVQVVK